MPGLRLFCHFHLPLWPHTWWYKHCECLLRALTEQCGPVSQPCTAQSTGWRCVTLQSCSALAAEPGTSCLLQLQPLQIRGKLFLSNISITLLYSFLLSGLYFWVQIIPMQLHKATLYFGIKPYIFNSIIFVTNISISSYVLNAKLAYELLAKPGPGDFSTWHPSRLQGLLPLQITTFPWKLLWHLC